MDNNRVNAGSARGAAALIRCLSEELTEKEIKELVELKDSILKRISNKIKG